MRIVKEKHFSGSEKKSELRRKPEKKLYEKERKRFKKNLKSRNSHEDPKWLFVFPILKRGNSLS
ncbi:hypothetical protein DLM78_19575 [Leptospira stimsonii]|uniref:Uncharacterized protein n=1 Tax=Leptospira stimsonii TaxID=2202203 RepID=A0A8B3CL13_9LEPT|nr:hypothetical protein DLM78_19575 [Leptospira stimsonii]